MLPPGVIPHRFAEASALLPILHARPGTLRVAVLGPFAGLMAGNALRWRDTAEVLTFTELPEIQDRRVKVINALDPASVDVVLLSPEQLPGDKLIQALKPGGVLSTLTLEPEKWRGLTVALRKGIGSATPWREHLPQPLFGVLGCVGGPCKRLREPPPSARRLTLQYLPCLFTFGKDELGSILT